MVAEVKGNKVRVLSTPTPQEFTDLVNDMMASDTCLPDFEARLAAVLGNPKNWTEMELPEIKVKK